MGKDYFPCYDSYLEKTAKLSDQELGRLFRALMKYSAAGETTQLAGREALAYDFIVYDIDRARDHYQEVSNARSKARGGKRDDPAGEPATNATNATIDNKRNNCHQKEQLSSNETIDNNCGENEYENEYEYEYEYENEDNTRLPTTQEKPTISAELRQPPASTPPVKTPFIALPLNDGSEHMVFLDDVERWGELYPAVDVHQELRNMRGWLEGNPTKRKTKRGITKFITSWLSRTQNKGGTNGYRPSPRQGGGAPYDRGRAPNYDRLEGWDGGALAGY